MNIRRNPRGRRMAAAIAALRSVFLNATGNSYVAAAHSDTYAPTTLDIMSIAIMVNPTAFPGNGSQMALVGMENIGVASSYAIRMGSSSFGDALTACVYSVATEAYGNSSLAKGGRYTCPTPGIWSLVTEVFDASKAGNLKNTLYVNTNPISRAGYTGTQPADILLGGASALEAGASKAAGARSNYLDGSIAKIYIYDYALTETQQLAILQGNAPTDYIRYWSLEGVGTEAKGGNAMTLGGGAAYTNAAPSVYSGYRKVHFIGDSNTWGQESAFGDDSRGGFRRYAHIALAQAGYILRSVGTIVSANSYLSEHGGLSGGTVSDLFTEADASAGLAPTDVVVAIGTNNARSGQPVSCAQTRADLVTLMGKIYTGQSPATHVLNIPPIPSETQFGREFGDGVAGYTLNYLCPDQVALSRNVRGVNIPYRAATHVGPDGVHLNQAAHILVGTTHLPSYLINRTAQGTTPAAAARATLRANASVGFLMDGFARPTEVSGKVSSRLDLHADDSGTGSLTMSQGTALSRVIWTGAGDEYRAGQDDATVDYMTIAAGSCLSGLPYTAFALIQPYYSPDTDLNIGHAIYALQGQGSRWIQCWIRETAPASGVFKLMFVSHQGGAGTPMWSVPWTHQTSKLNRIVVQGDGSGSAPTVYVDGVSQTVSSEGTATITADSGSIGAIVISSTVYFAAGMCIRQVGICNGNDANTLAAVNTYLSTQEYSASTPSI